ncbi:MAG: class I SAM-dependent methyltransferase [Burkholderiales bacterium]|nr:class I SAM-dependent methyltransferase [Burkholderiales bacterium]
MEKFVGKSCTYLEIGVQKGGSLRMMQEYLGKDARTIGVDIDPECAKLREVGREIYIGNQSDTGFLEKLKQDCGEFDIIVDDGGHTADQQITSFLSLFPALREGGIYLVEDMHAVFWLVGQESRYGINFYDFARGLVEKLSLYNIDQRLVGRYHEPRAERSGIVYMNNFALNEIFAIHFYDSIIVFEKRRREEPLAERR